MNQLQQGDVLLKKINVIPSNAKKLKSDKRGFVLAEGESTGHYHAVIEQEGVELYEHEDTLFLHVEK